MKSYNNLYGQICSYENLWSAFKKSRLGRRHKEYVQRIEFEQEKEVVALRNELLTHTYQPGKYKEFAIVEPKKRMISAAPYRDRVIHHALCT